MTDRTATADDRTSKNRGKNRERDDTITGAEVVEVAYDGLGSLEIRIVDMIETPTDHGARIRRMVFASVWGIDSVFSAPLALELTDEVVEVRDSPLLNRYREWCDSVGQAEQVPRRHFRVTFDLGVIDVVGIGYDIVLQTELWASG